MKNVNTGNHTEFTAILQMIEDARKTAYAKVNEQLVLLYFNTGNIISQKVQLGNWGDNTINELAGHIEARFPGLKGFNRRGLYRMKQFYEAYSCEEFVASLMSQIQPTENEQITFVTALLTQIAWTHHLLILSKTKTPAEKLFYINISINEKLSSRELERHLNSAAYERASLAAKQIKPQLDGPSRHIFKDPYIFEFLSLPDGHTEHDLEAGLIRNLQQFILEIGRGFAYMGNQFRIQVGNKDYYTDLLFYHRDLQCLVLFELKIGEFEPEYLGKLNFYLEALDRDIKRPYEKPSIGVLLCKGKDLEVVEYAMARNTSPALIADYEIKLIPKRLLAEKLHQLGEVLKREV